MDAGAVRLKREGGRQGSSEVAEWETSREVGWWGRAQYPGVGKRGK